MAGESAVGGPIEEISIRGRRYVVASDADTQRKLGGFEKEAQSNGDGTVRYVKSRVPWSLAGLVVEINDVRNDQEELQKIANQNEDVDISITYASGVTYQAVGTIVDEIVYNSQNTTATISLSGGGTLDKQ